MASRHLLQSLSCPLVDDHHGCVVCHVDMRGLRCVHMHADRRVIDFVQFDDDVGRMPADIDPAAILHHVALDNHQVVDRALESCAIGLFARTCSSFIINVSIW